MRLVRATITIPATVLAQLDRMARRLERSRSWCVAEAVRRFVSEDGAPRASAAVVRETAPAYAALGLGEQRRLQLEADLALTPAERVRAADAVARVGLRRESAPARILQFDRYEDYLEWQRGEGLLL